MSSLYQVLSPAGELVGDLKGQLDVATMIKMYENMVLVRQFDRKSINLQRQGRMGTYAPFEGQEASQVGSAMALTPGDWLFPTYRDHAAAIVHGQAMARVFLYWMGHMEGSISPKHLHIMPPCVPIATQMVHAVGTSWASKLQNEKHVSIAYFGDGASSEGDFHEALNFAGVFQTPTIFFCQNNGFAISVPFSQQSASKTIAQRSAAYDIPGIRIDGNDIFAVWLTMKEAMQRALEGKGPTLIEAVTFRYGAHTTADDPKKYRDQESLSEEWRQERDPLQRVRVYMENQGLWNETKEAELIARVNEQIDAALVEAESYPKSKPEDMFKHVYAEPSWMATEQESELVKPSKQEGIPA
ncbi:pyruvate dehydrogenase (acetyl-transferring) E1 component subunit alpha [Brevibacillus sp. Leaf182]|uniref:pyruvate dehydrogenase (acetyl-transferring) E1 component subunit alpha n=1 Tax=Brevibacillus sp. Leaf182 TaxID=1736290 RepID=UPI0006F58DB6|nr:pyruvate dehydrogenase (acetyl-transferring) E1 component subunit alpha [Brevibacillus sp. Leaf182]RAT94574.1 pyruvate dehydrogenase (acetyl-transferring) E1 component subunit alpha [Brevibacillus sp. Leaf182]